MVRAHRQLGWILDAALLAALAEEIVWQGESHLALYLVLALLALECALGLHAHCRAPSRIWRYASLLVVLAALAVLSVWGANSGLGHAAALAAAAIWLIPAAGAVSRPVDLLFMLGADSLLLFSTAITLDEHEYAWLRGEPAAAITYGLIWTGAVLLAFLVTTWRGRVYGGRALAILMALGAVALLFRLWLPALQWKNGWGFGENLALVSAIALLGSRVCTAKKPAHGRSTLGTKAEMALVLLVALGLGALFLWGRSRINGLPLPYAQEYPFKVAPAFVAQLLVSEDPIFFQHSGIDFKRLRDAVREAVQKEQYGRGGSTLTMQLAKMRYLSYTPTLFRKLKQCILAIWLELKYSKREILWNYINAVAFADGVIGIRAASSHFFQLEPSELSVDQAKELVLSVPDPARYNPSFKEMPKQVRFWGYATTARFREYGPRLTPRLKTLEFVGN